MKLPLLIPVLLIQIVQLARPVLSSVNRTKRQAANCFAVLNEANIDHPTASGKQFIEIIKTCSEYPGETVGKSLEGYKLVIIRGYPVQIVFVLDLSEFSMQYVIDEGFFFVLGGSGVDLQWKTSLTDSRIQSALPDAALPLGDDSPYGILLMYSAKKTNLKDVKLSKRDLNGRFIPRTLDFNFSIMKSYTLDMLVYGRKVFTNRCAIFEKIIQGVDFANNADRIAFEGEQYLLRDLSGDEDLSLNRCTSETTPFVPRRYRLGNPTPGSTNDCSGATFFIEDHLSKLVLQPTSTADVTALESCEPDTPSVSAEKYRDLSAVHYNQLLQHEMGRAKEACANANSQVVATAMDEVQLVSNQQSVQSLGQRPIDRIVQTGTIDTHMIELCKDDFPFNGELLRKPEVQKWLEVSTMGGNCRYSCRYCTYYFQLGFKGDSRHKRQMCTMEGYWNKQATRNKDQVLEHMDLQVHQEAVNFITELSLAASDDQLLSILKEKLDKDDEGLKQTMFHVYLNYVERIAGVSWRKHPLFVKFLGVLGVDMGIHHFHATAAEQMNEIMSSSFHETLLKFLVQENNEFSLIADGSTDNTNIPYLICYIQSLEDGYPMTYFYRLVELSDGESAESIFSSLKAKIEEDGKAVPGFQSYFISKLAAVATDGHPAMMGSQNSFYTRLKAYVGRYIPQVWCFSHRLDLGIKKGLVNNKDKAFAYFKTFEGYINKFYVFYMSFGSKNWQHLTDIAEYLGLHVNRIRYFFSVRWSSSHYEAIKSIYSSYQAIILDLIAIGQDDSEFNRKAKDNARDLHAIVEDKTFAFMLHEYMDFLYLFKQISEAFQGSEGLLIAKAGLVQAVIDKLRELKAQPGTYLTSFLQRCSSDRCELGHCTIESYFQSQHVAFAGTALGSSHPDINVPELRPKMYDALVDGISSYFNLPLLKSLEMFDPASFQTETEMLLSLNQAPNAYCTAAEVRVEDWNLVCRFFFDDNAIPRRQPSASESERQTGDQERYTQCINSFNDWKNLATAISSNAVMKSNVGETSAAFWFIALRSPELPWTPTLTTIIHYALVTPFGSSDAERGFSILNTVKTKYRNKLSAKTVENIIRVVINGPADITKLKAERYAREFLKKHVKPDDLSFRGGRKKNPEGDKTFRKSSRLF